MNTNHLGSIICVESESRLILHVYVGSRAVSKRNTSLCYIVNGHVALYHSDWTSDVARMGIGTVRQLWKHQDRSLWEQQSFEL